jgi:hypothetical protein
VAAVKVLTVSPVAGLIVAIDMFGILWVRVLLNLKHRSGVGHSSLPLPIRRHCSSP